MSHKNIVDSWPIDVEDFKKLANEVELELKREGITFPEDKMDAWQWMVPGMVFLPYSFAIACHPAFSFLWADLGTRAVVTPEVKELFEHNDITGVVFHRVDISFVGKASADYYPPNTEIPGWYSDDPFPLLSKDMNKVEPEPDPESFGPLYYMQINHSGPDWRGKSSEWPRCPDCRRIIKTDPKPDDMIFREKNLCDYDMFRSRLTQGIVVSDKVYQMIQGSNLTNKPVFTPLDIKRGRKGVGSK